MARHCERLLIGEERAFDEMFQFVEIESKETLRRSYLKALPPELTAGAENKSYEELALLAEEYLSGRYSRTKREQGHL